MKQTLKYAFVLLALVSTEGWAQANDDQTAVRNVVDRLFKAMELGDSAMLRTAFAERVSMATVFRDKGGIPQIRMEDSLDGFLKAVGSPHEQTWYEEIWNVDVKIDGDLAQVWCDYAFYLDKTFHHCGVDAFHLFRSPDGWKVFHLSDTRRTSDCQVPEEIKQKRD